MPPRRSSRRVNNATPTPPPPPPQYDPVMVQAAVTAVVETTLMQINTNGAGGTGSSTNHLNHGTGHGYIRECTYKEFSNAKPKTFNGVGGVIALMQWFEKTETVFEICACPETSKVKFAACTFSDRALTWWKGHVEALSLPVANAMSWEDLKILMLEEYCPRGEIQKLEHELWNLRMTGSDAIAYTARFSDLSALCPSMVNPESKKVERYIWGLSPQIQGHVLASNPVTFDSAKRLAQRLIDHGVKQGTITAVSEPPKDIEDRRKPWDKRKGETMQENPKRQQLVTAHSVTISTTPTPTRSYNGNQPKCNRCNFHHHGPCREMHCIRCNSKGHTSATAGK